MKPIKNELSKSLKGNKYYNPNTFNAIDGLLAYFTILIAFFAVGKLLQPCVNYIVDRKIIGDYFLLEILLGLISQGIILAVAITFFKIKKVGFFSGEGYTFNVNAIDLLMSVMLILAIGLCFYSLHVSFLDDMTGIFGDLGLTIPESVVKNSNIFYMAFYTFIIVPIFPAIIEELLFRGIVMRGMAKNGVVFSIIGSSILFATMHGSVGMLILQFLVGLSIGIVVTITKNHFYGVAMHFTNNLFLSIILTLPDMAGGIAPHLEFVVSAFVTIYGIVFLIISAYYFLKKYMAKYKAEILGVKKQKSQFEKTPLVCYSFLNYCDREYYLKEYASLDKDLIENTNTVFLYKDKFVKFNKNSSAKLTYILYALALVVSCVMIFI